MIGLLLKILGIVLAVLLGVIVLLMCLILFVSVRYEVNAEMPGKLDDITVKLKFSWIFRLIAGEAGYRESQFYWKVRAAWFRFGGEKEESMEDVADNAKEEIKEAADTVIEEAEKIIEEPSIEEKKDKEGIAGKKAEPEVERKETDGKKTRMAEKKKISVFQRIKNKLKAVWEKIKCIFLKICDNIKNISEIKDNIIAFLTDEAHTQAFRKGKKEFKWIVRFLKPKKFRLNLHYGFDDPYRTGQVLAGLSMIYPFIGDHMNVQSDFENQVLEGNFHMKGNLRMIYPVIYLVKLVTDKNVRRTFIDGKNFKFK